VRHVVDKRIALDVKLAPRKTLQQIRDLSDIIRPNMPLIGPGVNGDAVRARIKANLGTVHDAGNIQRRPRIAERRDLVHVDRKLRYHNAKS
jgi:hypothetical protein